jgi:hypothetical protein
MQYSSVMIEAMRRNKIGFMLDLETAIATGSFGAILAATGNVRKWPLRELAELQLSPRSLERSLIDTGHILAPAWDGRKNGALPHRNPRAAAYTSSSCRSVLGQDDHWQIL